MTPMITLTSSNSRSRCKRCGRLRYRTDSLRFNIRGGHRSICMCTNCLSDLVSNYLIEAEAARPRPVEIPTEQLEVAQ